MTDVQLAYERARAEEAERREAQFRNWWAGVSKQLDDLKRQYARETWERAESCDTHGEKIKTLDAQLLYFQRRSRETEDARVKLVIGLHVLQDIVREHRAGNTRADLTVDELIGAVEAIVWRTLDQKPETEKRPPKVVQASLLDVGGNAA
jgi:hypothetical protein